MDTVVDSKAVNDCLDKIRPYIQHDGGDIELLGVECCLCFFQRCLPRMHDGL